MICNTLRELVSLRLGGKSFFLTFRSGLNIRDSYGWIPVRFKKIFKVRQKSQPIQYLKIISK
jgi:hypothetical protein